MRIDPDNSELTAVIETGYAYESPFVAVADGAVWVREYEGAGAGAVTQIDPQTDSVVRSVEILGEATNIAIGLGSVWVTSSYARDGVLVEIAADTGRFRRAVSLGQFDLTDVAVGPGAVWIAAAGGDGNAVLRIEPTTGDVVARIPLSDWPSAVAVGHGAVWVVSGPRLGSSTVWRIDPSANDVVTTIDLRGPAQSSAIATGAGEIWVALDTKLFRIDPVTNRISETIEIERYGGGIAVGEGSVWVVNQRGGSVSRIDTDTLQEVATISIAGACGCSVAVGAGGVWAS